VSGEAAPLTRLAVLDMAGTTVRDDGIVEHAFLEAMAALGIPSHDPSMPEHLDVVRTTMGQSKIDVFTRLFGGDVLRAEQANRCFEDAVQRAVHRGGVEALPGAAETLDVLRARGVRVCLTTGFSPATRDLLIGRLGWDGLVDLVLAPGDRGARGRPAPDMILVAMLHFEIDDVREVAVVGDTTNDLLAGTRAGAGIVAGVLTGAHTRRQLEAAPHTHLLASIGELAGLL
jgi:phosphoglycolate phosphatase